jgi:head-tail adaptor
MRYGRLDRKIAVQRKVVTIADDGSEVEAWTDLVGNRWAAVDPVNGDERFAQPQISATQQTEFLVRWSSTLQGLTPKDRIVYPPTPVTSPETATPDTAIYDIAAVHEVGRREGLRIIAIRRTDT